MTTTTAENTAGPVLIGIDPTSWKGHLDRVNVWIAHTLGAQVEFRTLAADTAAKVKEPHWHEYLTGVAETAARHEKDVEEMFRVIGREPWRLGKMTGPVLAKSREALAFLVSKTTGASSPWTDLQQLHMVSLGAISAVSVAEQLGSAIGIPALAEIAFRVTNEKFTHHRLIEEAVLEFAATAILYGSDVGDRASEGVVFAPAAPGGAGPGGARRVIVPDKDQTAAPPTAGAPTPAPAGGPAGRHWLDQLEAERARLTAVLRQMPSGVIIAEAPSGRLLHYNEEAARLLRHPLIPASAVPDSAFECAVHPDGRAYLPEEYPIARALRGEVVKEANLRCRRAGACDSYLSVNSAPIRDASGRIVAAVSTIHDVSERRRSELQRAELLRRLVGLQEEERHRIARELHDQMGQHLTAFLLDLEALKGHTQDRPAAAEVHQRLRDLADRMGQDVHRIAFELRPTALDDWGLETALTNYVTEWSRRCRVVAQVHCTGLDRRLPAGVETALYRVAQEALTNVSKHARAGRVSVIVERHDGEARAIIEDDGRGFDAGVVLGEPDARRRLGLLGMEERVTQLGGTLEVESSPGGGTSLFFRVPLGGAGGADHG